MIGRRSAVFLAALLATSCGVPLMKLPVGPAVSVSDADTVLAQALASCGRISSISAELAVRGTVAGQRLRGRLLVGIAPGNAMYLEAPAPFGAPLFVLGATADDATLLLPRDRRVLEHGEPSDVMRAIAGVPLDASELRATLTGCAARPPDSSSVRGIGDTWRIVSGEPTLYLQRTRAGEPWRLVSVVREGDEGWRTDYSAFDGALPRRVRLLSTGRRGFDLRLDVSQVDTEASLDPQSFRVSIPSGTLPVTLDELRQSGPFAR